MIRVTAYTDSKYEFAIRSSPWSGLHKATIRFRGLNMEAYINMWRRMNVFVFEIALALVRGQYHILSIKCEVR